MNRDKPGYTHILMALDNSRSYTGANIAVFARDHGLLKGIEPAPIEMQRVRIFCRRLAIKKGFPRDGDAKPFGWPTWYGERWKAALNDD